MKKSLIIILSCICAMSYTQTNLKTYTNKNGNAIQTFTYYQDSKTLENIKHGNFTYNSQSSNGKAKIIIKGKYVNGLKDGIWTWDIINYNYGNRLAFTKFIYKVTKTFNRGLRNGQWHSKKIIEAYQGQNLIERFSYELNENYTNNILTGKLIYKENQNLPVELYFNNEGGLVGDYLLNYAGKLRLSTNQQGIVTRYNHGKEEIINEEALLVANKYLKGEITQDESEKQNISVIKKYIAEYFYDDHVFFEDGIKDPNDGEITVGLDGGYYIFAKFNPALIELNKLQAENEISRNKESFQKILENGRWLTIKEMYDKEKNTVTKKYDKNSCDNISFYFLRNILQMYKQNIERDYMNAGNKCGNKSYGKELPVLYDYLKKQIIIKTDKGDNTFIINQKGKEIILESDSEKITLYVPSGPDDKPDN